MRAVGSLVVSIAMLAISVRADEPAPVELKNKSSFKMDPSSRNPFWPIGWKPAKTTGSEPAGDIPPGAFVVSAITLDHTGRFAIVNGKILQEGQKFGLMLSGQTYQLVLKRIEDGRIVLGRQDEEIVIQLRRK
jgi:hypothetical protein